jgi:uncharacterized protein YbjQ (UPF0145 family)
MKKTFVLALSSSLVFACVSENVVEVKPQAAAIKLVREDEKPFRCKVLGDVHGTSRSSDRDKARKGAEADMKNHAAALKANYVVVERENAGNVGSTATSDAFMSGKALKCEEEKEDKDKG